MSRERLLPLLRAEPTTRETTVYVKGFLGRNETREDFGAWSASHEQLVASHGWCRRAAGYAWPAGSLYSIGRLPVPFAAISNAAWAVYRRSRRLRAAPLQRLAVGAVEDVALLAGRLIVQYVAASRHAASRAEQLAGRLARLRRRYERLRVVAHSLGCRHVVEAVSSLGPGERPDEIHLCAPAFHEDVATPALDRLAAGPTFVYYSRRDMVLATAFRAMTLGSALGAVGPSRRFRRLRALDVSDVFEWRVHHEYGRLFHSMAVDSRLRSVR